MPTDIQFRDVCFRTPARGPSPGRLLLDGISFGVEEGTTTAILGRRGSGKTTLLRTVNRMVDATSGTVLVGGKSVCELDLIAVRRGIGYVIQETGLFPHFSIERNVGVVLEAEGRPKDERRRRSRELLTAVGLDPDSFASRRPNQLSGGQRQRVGLARALAADPGVLLMDEPFGALDPITRAEMQTMLKELLGSVRKTVLLVTHHLDEALYLADRVVFLDHGEVAADLPAGEVLASADASVQRYVAAVHHGGRA